MSSNKMPVWAIVLISVMAGGLIMAALGIFVMRDYIKAYIYGYNVGYVYGYVHANDEGLRNFCKQYDYVPEQYIEEFHKRFANTINHYEEDFAMLKEDAEFNKELDEITYTTMMETLEETRKTHPDITPKDLCMGYDENTETLLNDLVIRIKKEKPKLFIE